MNKPYIILHMVTSVNSKITGDFLTTDAGKSACDTYYKIHSEYKADAYACGRITMEESFTKGYRPRLSAYKDLPAIREDFVAKKHARYAVAIDPHGVLGWKKDVIKDEDPGYNNAHVIEVLTQDVADEYIAFLRKRNVSYIFCGEKEIDVNIMLEKLYSLFGIEKLLLEGGGKTNTLFYNADVIDEISLVICPKVSDGLDLFVDGNFDPSKYRLKGINMNEKQVMHSIHLKK
ncbi:MAG: pyrimidine reductase [Clostridiales bacterium]|nr:pyrimidine reductase [Clostridiales bacterium]